ncbi:MAG TPA: hypothetical protein IGR15_05590 [Synechococcus sp. M44_DOE_062]|nr:hypothetical protein [Synechococcus sp. M44_DOE_062]
MNFIPPAQSDNPVPISIKLGVAFAVDPKGHFVRAAPLALPFSALPSKGSRLR